MIPRWPAEDLALLRREYACSGTTVLAAKLGRSPSAIRCKARKLRLRRRHPWTAGELDLLRQHYGRTSTTQLAALMGRPVGHLHQTAARHGLSVRRQPRPTAWLDRVKALHAEGKNDVQIGRILGEGHEAIRYHRRRLGLPAILYNAEQTRGALAGQQQTLGIASTGELRSLGYRRYAASCGWPAHLRLREVQILNLLARVGLPMPRKMISQGIGMKWRDIRHVLSSGGNSKRPNNRGSYLANLAHEGLVTRLVQALRDRPGRGCAVDLYCLGPAAIAILAARATIQGEHDDSRTKEAQHHAG